VIVEAMKMRHELTAGCNGIVQRIAVKPEEQVANRQLLVELK
jgi:biotin carboxyl carrier protein